MSNEILKKRIEVTSLLLVIFGCVVLGVLFSSQATQISDLKQENQKLVDQIVIDNINRQNNLNEIYAFENGTHSDYITIPRSK